MTQRIRRLAAVAVLEASTTIVVGSGGGSRAVEESTSETEDEDGETGRQTISLDWQSFGKILPECFVPLSPSLVPVPSTFPVSNSEFETT